ncbi:DUF262 domain-containing protein [Pseudoalteromonas rubra]|uniref:DUF262 domain-containing protein n=1 Tax=Pseudoalteromonas rubra TaxID=43658 RepID=A0A5S3UYX4_9GAMM|nr:DUF262 domain-containing protein [Pseudoalteromonas rubra]QPB85364.1 DUF262 domain-containing protein [Pseudoalteromonas rubra]
MSAFLKEQEFEDIFKKHIKTSVYSISIKTLFSERRRRKIDYSPYYQRNYVWDNSKATFFIESILLGTDVPPLIFFNSGASIEVIDGRQRYETIKKFKDGELKLNIKGLTKLPQLQGQVFSKLDSEVQGLFDDAKIRIFEFEVHNEPKMSSLLEDKIKKEIFRRYNSGITPLSSAEIDNATYDEDHLTNKLREKLLCNPDLGKRIYELFISKSKKSDDISVILQFLRKCLVLSSFPIKTFASGSNRAEVMELLYSVKSDNTENPDEVCDNLFSIIDKVENLVSKLDNDFNNRLLNECMLWGLYILREDGFDIDEVYSKVNISKFKKFFSDNSNDYSYENSHHYKAIIERYYSTSVFLEEVFHHSFDLYIKDDDFKTRVKELRQSENEAKLKLIELASLRVQKPEPSRIPVEEIVEEVNGSRYLIRPSYQRPERINLFKASAIIESIILGISLPPLFVFKSKNNVKEVIDGQQRLLSIIGFMGKTYIDENGNKVYPKLNAFKLSRLKILRELNGLRFNELELNVQDKIYDFMLSVIEIDYHLNNDFEPVDLFIRLNNKPYPIKENSFEMWNSFVDKDVIDKIRVITDCNIDWFYIKKRNKDKTSDRMQNEELVALLVYNLYNKKYRPGHISLGFYLRDGRINCRVTNKKDVSVLLEKMITDSSLKRDFISSIEEVKNIISSLKGKLSTSDMDSMTDLFGRENNKRYLVDFYILFQILQRLDKQRLAEIELIELKKKLSVVQKKLKQPPKGENQQNYFDDLLDSISV